MWVSIINGKVYKGDNITVNWNEVFVDWKKVNISDETKKITIDVTWDIDSLKIDHCDFINIQGNCNTVSSMNWDIDISWSVSGGVTNMNWDITCGKIEWNVSNHNWDIKHR